MIRFLALLAFALALANSATARTFTAKDLATLDRVSDPRLSPDGKYAIYDLRVTDYDANKASHELWIVEIGTPGATPRKLDISRDGASSARWASDSQHIYFMSSRVGETDQVFRTDIAGTTATQVTKAPLDVGSFKLSPDSKRIVYSLSVYPDCDSIACTTTRLDKKKETKASGMVFDRTFVRHWDTWADGRRNHLFAASLDDAGTAGEPVMLMKGFDGDSPSKPDGDDSEYTFAPDGNSLVFSAREAGTTEPWSTNFDLFKVALDGKATPQNLTAANKAWDTGAVFSPDGTKIAYRAMKRPGFEADRYGVMIMDMASGKSAEIAPKWDRSPDKIVWTSDGKSLLATAGDIGQGKIFFIDASNGKIAELTGPGHIGGFDIGAKNIVYTQDKLDMPGQLFSAALDGASPTQLTKVNEQKLADITFGEAEQFSFAGWNNETVYGYVVKPSNFEAGRKYPVAFLIHGGPQGSFGNLFHYRWNAQTYANAGFAVVMIDFHGSTGYGQGFTDAISQHWGDRPLEDLKKGWAAAQKNYTFIDGGRACALGGSYGGFMVNWIAGNWSEPWKCLVNHDGIFDTRSMGYSTEELWFSEWENGGTPYDKPEAYEKFNPSRFVKNWKTPMLVVHSDKDYRVPPEQGLSTFNALQRRGVPSQLLFFPNENHWVLKPQNLVQWHDQVLGWLNKWTGNNAAL